MDIKTTSTQQLIALAKNRASADTEHSYTKAPDFEPHTWVWLAMRDAYHAGVTDAAQPGEPIAWQIRCPRSATPEWRDCTQKQYDATLSTGHAYGSQIMTKDVEVRALYAGPSPSITPPPIINLSECRARGWEDGALAYRSGWNDCRRAALGEEPLGYAGCHELATSVGVKS